MQKVFVVILNWNRPELTIDCLKSVSKLKGTNYELKVVIVDNASSDDSIERIQKLKPKFHNDKLNLKIIENKNNLGFAGGNNVGIEYSLKKGADFVMVLNNDTILDENLIVEFLRAAKKYPKAAILSPKIYFAKGYEFHKDRYKKSELGNVIWAAGGDIDWDNIFGVNRGVDEVDRGQFDKQEEIKFATGTCMFVRSKAFKEVGMFDEKYFMYFEDVDLSVRMRKKGWKLFYIPKAIVWHKVAQSSGIGSNLNDYFITRNRLLFGAKYAPPRNYLALIRESIKHLATGRKWQKKGVISYFIKNFGPGSWRNNT